MDEVTRFHRNIGPGPGECLNWLGKPNKGHGYFKVSWRKSRITAHVYAFYLAHGRLPAKENIVHHICENKICVNAAHLEEIPRNRHPHLHPDTCITMRNVLKTHCDHGHPFSGDNLILRTNGNRSCRACAQQHSRELNRRPDQKAKRLARDRAKRQR